MKNYYGVSDIPTASSYIGISNYSGSSADSTVVTHETYSDNPSSNKYPKKLVTAGLENTKNLAQVGYDRIKTLALSNPNFKGYLNTNGFITTQNVLTHNWSHTDLDNVFTQYDDVVKSIMTPDGAYYPYHLIVHPLAVKIQTFSPENLSGNGITYYAKGNWYIPSKEEIELLVWYRIISTVSTKGSTIVTAPESYWNASTFSAGDSPLSIFSKIASVSGDKQFEFQCLNEWHLIADKVTTDNNNFIYDAHVYTSGSSYVIYGWHNSWATYPQFYQTSHINCARDKEYSIAPCCWIEVTKSH
jgi:hypothetical protein